MNKLRQRVTTKLFWLANYTLDDFDYIQSGPFLEYEYALAAKSQHRWSVKNFRIMSSDIILTEILDSDND